MNQIKRCPTCQKAYSLSQTHCAVDNTPLIAAPDAVPDSAALHDPLVGQVLEDRYQVERVLGSGGMGTVYLAQHTTTQQMYALKVIHGHLLNDAGALNRFDREARALGTIDHPNIVDVYDHGQTPAGVPFLVMEYLRGTTLRQGLEALSSQGGGLPLIQAASITRQVAEALAHVHQLGIVHRDVKPDNIQLTVHNDRSVFAKLFDFGIARIESQVGVTEHKSGPPSTLAYAAPEIHMKAGALSPAIDVYALGVTLFEMVTNQRPFSGHGLEVVWAHMKSKPRRLGQVRTDVKIPESLEQLTAHMLEKEPGKRPTMAEVAQRLAPLASGLRAESIRDLHSLRTYVLPMKRSEGGGTQPTTPQAVGQSVGTTTLQVLSNARDIDQIETRREQISTQLQKECETVARHLPTLLSPELIGRLSRCAEIAKAKNELTLNLTRLEDALGQEKTAARTKRNALRQRLQELRDVQRAVAAGTGLSQPDVESELAQLERAYATAEAVSETAAQLQRESTRQQLLRAALLDAQRKLASDLLDALRAAARTVSSSGDNKRAMQLAAAIKRLMELMGEIDALNTALQQS